MKAVNFFFNWEFAFFLTENLFVEYDSILTSGTADGTAKSKWTVLLWN